MLTTFLSLSPNLWHFIFPANTLLLIILLITIELSHDEDRPTRQAVLLPILVLCGLLLMFAGAHQMSGFTL